MLLFIYLFLSEPRELIYKCEHTLSDMPTSPSPCPNLILFFYLFIHRRVYKERLGVPSKVIIGFQSHADTATKSGSTTKNMFVA